MLLVENNLTDFEDLVDIFYLPFFTIYYTPENRSTTRFERATRVSCCPTQGHLVSLSVTSARLQRYFWKIPWNADLTRVWRVKSFLRKNLTGLSPFDDKKSPPNLCRLDGFYFWKASHSELIWLHELIDIFLRYSWDTSNFNPVQVISMSPSVKSRTTHT